MDEGYYDDATATFGDRMAAAREAVGLSQGKLAQRLGVRSATIAAWEADRSEPRANRLQMLAGMLNVSMVWLMTGAGEGVRPPGPEDRDAELTLMLGELREAQTAQRRASERLKRLEARLTALMAQGDARP
jgi:transcriptional regulator with XRE-family HTH domain